MSGREHGPQEIYSAAILERCPRVRRERESREHSKRGESRWLTNTGVDTRSEFDGLALPYLLIAIAVMIAVFAAIGFMLVRYRAREERISPDPSPRSGGHRIEAAYAVALTAIAVALIVLTLRTESRVDTVSASPATTIDVVAFQWGWRFVYPDGPTVIGYYDRPPVLRVPVGETVRFQLSSRDVIHAFWIPSLRFKRDAFPNRTTSFDLRFEQTGLQHDAGRCAEFCGLQHSAMLFDVLGLPPDEYASWLRTPQAQVGAVGPEQSGSVGG